MSVANRLASFLGIASLLLATSTGWSTPTKISLPGDKTPDNLLPTTVPLEDVSTKVIVYRPALCLKTMQNFCGRSLAACLDYAIECNNPVAIAISLYPFNAWVDFTRLAETNHYLIEAAYHRSCAAAKELLAYGNPIARSILLRATDSHNKGTALHIAAANGDLECVKAITRYSDKAGINSHRLPSIKPGDAPQLVDIYAPSSGFGIGYSASDGSTPLHLAAQNGHFKVVRFLMEKGANVNERREMDRATPMHLAIYNRHFKTVKALLKSSRIKLGLKLARGGNTVYEGGNTVYELAMESSLAIKSLVERYSIRNRSFLTGNKTTLSGQ